jgi:hypothetical protein
MMGFVEELENTAADPVLDMDCNPDLGDLGDTMELGDHRRGSRVLTLRIESAVGWRRMDLIAHRLLGWKDSFGPVVHDPLERRLTELGSSEFGHQCFADEAGQMDYIAHSMIRIGPNLAGLVVDMLLVVLERNTHRLNHARWTSSRSWYSGPITLSTENS